MMLVQPLTGSHNRQGFDCDRVELNLWLRQVARQHQDKGLSRTYVAVPEHTPRRIAGFYALTLAEIDSTHLPSGWHKKFPRRIPGVRLGRLAVDAAFQRKKLGELLLVDALSRAQKIYQEAGGVGLFVNALDERAAGFYRRFGFQSAPDQPLLLFLPTQALPQLL